MVWNNSGRGVVKEIRGLPNDRITCVMTTETQHREMLRDESAGDLIRLLEYWEIVRHQVVTLDR